MNSTIFEKGELVLCVHEKLIYKAKILQCSKNNAAKDIYYVHYVDWSKNWDEWLSEDRILKYNDANLKLQTETREKFYAALTSGAKKRKHKGIKSSGDINASSKGEHGEEVFNDDTPSTSRGCSNAGFGFENKEFEKDDLKYDTVSKLCVDGNKREVSSDEEELEEEEEKNNESELYNNVSEAMEHSVTESHVDADVETEEHIRSGVEVKIVIPDVLKQCLADDWVAISLQHKLITIPAKMTVQGLVNEYNKLKEHIKKRISAETLKYIVDCFNAIIAKQLLYNCERPQFERVLQQFPTVPLSEIYGSFHLLRLFTKLGSLLEYTVLDKESMEGVEVQIHYFLRFLEEKKSLYFNLSDYQDNEK